MAAHVPAIIFPEEVTPLPELSRADFPAQVRTLVAQRAGYQCSIPTCRRLTIGPGAAATQIADIGVASHIYSAARNGPRGTGGLSFEQRRSADNAIWLCADHGRLVDTNAGDQYPASLLRSWKGLHEAFCRLEMGGHARPFGWVESLKITEAPALLADREFYFSPRNLIVGENATGKQYSQILSLELGNRPCWQGTRATVG
jgi:hypothetical protein